MADDHIIYDPLHHVLRENRLTITDTVTEKNPASPGAPDDRQQRPKRE